MTAKILSIAGSDSGGGAGIQADIKTITSLGGYAATTITAITAQNTLGVSDIFPVSLENIEKQIIAVLDDIKPDIVKTGMLFNSEITNLVAYFAKKYTHIPFIIDPVMVATSGDMLLKTDSINSLISNLLPNCFMITPNLPEAEIIADMSIVSLEDMQKAAKKILDMGAGSVLLKGGHLKGGHLKDDLIYDYYLSASENKVFESKRINSRNTHGTGCTLASAIACKISHKLDVIDSITQARQYVRDAIIHSQDIGQGNGPLNHNFNISGAIKK